MFFFIFDTLAAYETFQNKEEIQKKLNDAYQIEDRLKNGRQKMVLDKQDLQTKLNKEGFILNQQKINSRIKDNSSWLLH